MNSLKSIRYKAEDYRKRLQYFAYTIEALDPEDELVLTITARPKTPFRERVYVRDQCRVRTSRLIAPKLNARDWQRIFAIPWQPEQMAYLGKINADGYMVGLPPAVYSNINGRLSNEGLPYRLHSDQRGVRRQQFELQVIKMWKVERE